LDFLLAEVEMVNAIVDGVGLVLGAMLIGKAG